MHCLVLYQETLTTGITLPKSIGSCVAITERKGKTDIFHIGYQIDEDGIVQEENTKPVGVEECLILRAVGPTINQ